MTVTADDLDSALASVVATLEPATDRDWSVPAGTLEWDCWHTGEHVADVLMSYTMQLVARPDGRYVRFATSGEKGASAAEVLEFVGATVRILATVVRTTPPDVRAWHPMGMADAEGFAAMGCVETLLHGEDIAEGLGLTLDAPRELCGRVLARLFPDEAAALATTDPWEALRWATGRTELPGRPRRERWRWYAAPLGE
ncbi:maleylpyruvate isomerase N-terminal domain-containing protein [Rugosimonospora africana]|nr:maleylpyruvate isomerase N-terminal domain-containing protein [Rugosimonospora africana]